MSFKDVYACTKATVVCYMATSTDKWIKAAWANECSKEHTSTKKIAEEVMAEVKVDGKFGMCNISIRSETVDHWKTAWTILQTKLQQGLQRKKMERLRIYKVKYPETTQKTTMDD